MFRSSLQPRGRPRSRSPERRPYRDAQRSLQPRGRSRSPDRSLEHFKWSPRMICEAVRRAANERCDDRTLQAIYPTVDDAVSRYPHKNRFHSEEHVKRVIKRIAEREVAAVLFPDKPKGASVCEVEGLIARRANTDVASIVASVQREPVPPATVMDDIKPNVEALLKKEGPSYKSLRSDGNDISDIKINNHLGRAFNLVRDTATKVSTVNTELYPLLHKYREDIDRPDGARACPPTRCGVTLPRTHRPVYWRTCLSPGAAVRPPLEALLRSTLYEIADNDHDSFLDNGSSDDDI